MSYVFSNIFTCLLAAALFGGVIGWLIKYLMDRAAASGLEVSWRDRLASIEGERDRLTATVRDSDGQLNTWKVKFAGLDGDFGNLKLQYETASARVSDLESSLSDWTGKAQAWTGERTKLGADAEAWKRQAAGFEARIAQTEATGQTRARDLESKLAAAIAADKADDAAYEKQIAELRATLGERDGRIAKLVEAGGELRSQLSAAQVKLSGAEDRFTKAVAGGQAGDAAYEQRIAALQKQLGDSQAMLAKAYAGDKADDDAYEKQIAALKVQLTKAAADAKASGEAHHSQLGDLRATLSGRDDRIARLIETDKVNDTRYEKSLADLRSQLTVTQVKLADAENRYAKAVADDKADDAAYEKRIGELNAKLTAAADELDAAKAKLAKAVADDKADAAAYEKRIAELNAKLTATADAAEAKLVKETGALNASLASIATERDAAKAQLAKAVAGDKADAAAYEKRVAEINAKLQAATAGQQALRQSFDALTAKYDALAKRAPEGDIERIEGIGPVYGQKLRSIGIAWVRQLLDRGADPDGRAKIVAGTGIKADLILTWVNAADLLRVDGITENWAELLEAAGVDTVKELRNRVPANLHKKLEDINPSGPGGSYAPTLPSLEEVERWVNQAKAMAPRVTH